MLRSTLRYLVLACTAVAGQAYADSIRVNIGGSAYTDSNGNDWVADSGCSAGVVDGTGVSILGTPDPFLFASHRWDPSAAPEMSCSYALQNGDYQVTIYLAETNSNNFSGGARLFDVNIEGAQVFNNVDMFLEGGANTALLKTTTVTVNDGQIDIEFIHQVKNPMVKAIEVVPVGNANPTITSAPVTSATVDTPYSYDVDATDDPGDTLTFSLDTAPAGMSINPNSGVISWTPDAGDLGGNPVTVRVEDQGNLADTQSFSVNVTAGNNPPSITSSPVTSATVNVAYNYDVDASDDPGDSLTFSLDTAPVGMSIDPNSGLISWTPVAGDEGGNPVTVRVEDQGSLADTQSFSVTVAGSGLPDTVRVNIGGPAYTDSGGKNWVADSGCDAGVVDTVGVSILGTPDPFLFGSHRWDPSAAPEMTCSYPLRAGDYDVTIYLAETNVNNFVAGARLFDVNIEGVQVFNDIDMFVEGGPNTALLKTATVTVSDGQIDIQFLHQAKNPMIKAISVVPVGGNSSPSIVSVPVTGATVDALYNYDVDAADDPGDTLTFSLDTAPTGMAIDPNTGLISWTPDAGDVGGNPVTVRVEDQGSLADTQSFSVTVTAANNPPSITSTAVTTATVGVGYNYDVDATDDPGDTLTFSLDTAPAGMAINPTTGLISWTPGAGNIGGNPVTVRVEDQGSLADTQSFSVTVSGGGGGNTPPSITSSPVTSASVGATYNYDVDATDDPGDTLTFSLDTAPAGMTINPNSGLISWTPGAGNVGGNPVTVRVEDQGSLADTQSFSVTVSGGGNAPPSITSTAVTNASVGFAYSYDVDATDDPGDTLTFSLDTAPAGMTIDPNSGLISWTPGAGNVGPNAVTVRVEDQGSLADTQSFSVTVTTPLALPVRVNIGGGAYTDSGGNDWLADSGCNAGNVSSVAGPIQGTPDQTLFLTHRWDPSSSPEMTCSYNVPPGVYEVSLYFAETNANNFANGARVFDVNMEGVLEFNDLDIYQEAGGDTALIKTTTLAVDDGQLNVEFIHQAKNPLVKAIQIRELPTGACNSTPRTQVLNGILPVSGGTGTESLLFSIPGGSNGSMGTAVITDATTGQFQYTPNGTGWGADTFDYQVDGLPGGPVVNTYTVIIEPRLMPLGDSITAGVVDGSDLGNILPPVDLRVGWRLPLYNDLVAGNYPVDFVGSQTQGSGVSGFDFNNEGHGGWTATEIAWGRVGYPTDGVRAWLEANPADIVLLHAGTNGLTAGSDIEVEQILDEIDIWEGTPGGNPVTVILAEIIDQNPINPDVAAFNANLVLMANDRISNPANPAYPDEIVLVDQRSALTYPNDLADSLHPTEAGYAKMKDVWKVPLNGLLPMCPPE